MTEPESTGQYVYKSGYTLTVTDLGFDDGMTVSISYNNEYRAILLPPEEVCKLTDTLLRSLGQLPQRLPLKLLKILRRLIENRGLTQKLQRGDKKAIRETLRILKDWNLEVLKENENVDKSL